jgi:hypothetical protein
MKKLIVLFILSFFSSCLVIAQTTPDINQVLNVSSDALSMPISGLTKTTTDTLMLTNAINCSTCDSILVRDGMLTKYRKYTLTSNWSLTGNSGLTAGTNFLGTNDSIDLVFKTKNTEYMRLNAIGNIGIGTTTPDFYGFYPTSKTMALSSSGAGTYSALALVGGTTGGGSIDFGNQTVAYAEITATSGSNLGFYTNTSNSGTTLSEKMRLSADGSWRVVNSANVKGLFARSLTDLASAPTTVPTSIYLQCGQNEYNPSSYRLIGFGYINGITGNAPAYIGYQEDAGATTGFTNGDLVFGTRNLTTNTAAVERLRISKTGLTTFTQTAQATGILKGIVYNGAVHTNQTLSTEIPSITFTTAGRQWATGFIQTQREILINKPTYSFVGASTIRDAATLTIDGAPVASTNATITRSMVLWTQSGLVRHDGTTEQLRVGYDSANYVSHTVGSTGSLTMAGTGTNTGMTFTNSGTGSFAFNSSSTTGTTTSSGLVLNANSLTSGTGIYASTTSVQDGNLASFVVNSTGALDGQTAINIATAGANSNSNKTTYGLQSSNTHTGTGSINVGGLFSATGGGTNYGLIVSNGSSGFGTQTPTSTVHINGSYAGSYVAKTANYTATSSDYCITFTSGTDTLTLPTAVGITGRIYIYKNISGNNGVIATTSSQTIDGTAAPLTAIANKKSYLLMSNGANWIIISVF